MPNIDKKQYICENCGKSNTYNNYLSINVVQDPSLEEKVLDNSLFRIKCGSCGKETYLDYSTLYSDVKNNFMIYYIPEDKKELEENITDKVSFTEELKKVYKDIKFRIVTKKEEFIEKILILKEGMNDRALEVTKFLIIISPNSKHSIARMLYLNKDKDSLYFETFIEGNKTISIKVPIDLYNETYQKMLKLGLLNEESFCKVDSIYALTILGKI